MDRTLGVVATSRKPHERRLAIHPAHLERIDEDVRARLFLERGYGERFGRRDAELAPLVAGLRERDELLAGCDVVVLPKPLAEDVAAMGEGQTLWGWPHCVQDRAMTQAAIDRRVTLLAWEAMNRWSADGAFDLHVFHRNNELAGYCSVLHALTLLGATGAYGAPLRAAVISFGATGRGAHRALGALGVRDITILTQRDVAAVAAAPADAQFATYGRDEDDPQSVLVVDGDEPVPLVEFLVGTDIVVNCVLQDPERPLVFVRETELDAFGPRNLFVDVSIDPGMGFEWARATSFDEPLLTVGPGSHYYAVDHSPSYLWNAATWEISEALAPYLRPVLEGPRAWEADETLRRAVEIRDGVVLNEKVLAFQERAAEYPHAPLAG